MQAGRTGRVRRAWKGGSGPRAVRRVWPPPADLQARRGLGSPVRSRRPVLLAVRWVHYRSVGVHACLSPNSHFHFFPHQHPIPTDPVLPRAMHFLSRSLPSDQPMPLPAPKRLSLHSGCVPPREPSNLDPSLHPYIGGC